MIFTTPFHYRHVPQTVSADGGEYFFSFFKLFCYLMRWDFRRLHVENVCPKCVCVSQGGPWPQPCLSLSQINSNCGLQLFAVALPDVPLFSVEAVEQNRLFSCRWRGEWKGWAHGWQKCGRRAYHIQHLQNGFLMPLNTTKPLALLQYLVSCLCRKCFRHHKHTLEIKSCSKVCSFGQIWRQAIPMHCDKLSENL